MIIWTISNGESGAADTRGRGATEATDTHLDPCYDRRGHDDPGGTARAACQLRDELVAALLTRTAGIGAPGATGGPDEHPVQRHRRAGPRHR